MLFKGANQCIIKAQCFKSEKRLATEDIDAETDGGRSLLFLVIFEIALTAAEIVVSKKRVVRTSSCLVRFDDYSYGYVATKTGSNLACPAQFGGTVAEPKKSTRYSISITTN